jgi:hypothetical protein
VYFRRLRDPFPWKDAGVHRRAGRVRRKKKASAGRFFVRACVCLRDAADSVAAELRLCSI